MSENRKPRRKRDVMVRLDLYQWVEEQMGKGRFWSFSHAVDVGLMKLRDSEKEN